jgi:hypothetical protein
MITDICNRHDFASSFISFRGTKKASADEAGGGLLTPAESGQGNRLKQNNTREKIFPGMLIYWSSRYPGCPAFTVMELFNNFLVL